MRPSRIISGGQTGADRAALDAAIASGVACGGWVPRGRSAEDGRIPDSYPNLRECDSDAVSRRTELNVADADATLILSHGPLRGGAAYTREVARRLSKPVLHVDLAKTRLPAAAPIILAWLGPLPGSTLNVAGPRASEDPEIYAATRTVIHGLLGKLVDPDNPAG